MDNKNTTSVYRTLKITDEAYCELLKVVSHIQLRNSGRRVTISEAIIEMARAYQDTMDKLL